MKKRLVNFLAIFALTFTLGLIAEKITNVWLFRVAFPETIALEGFQWEDFAFKLRPETEKEKRIVLVNIGGESNGRREIAQQLKAISKYNPKVIGIDVFFNCDGGVRDTINCPQLLDTLGNSLLSNAIRNAGNVVMVSNLIHRSVTSKVDPDGLYDSIEYSDNLFNQYAYNGFGDLPVETYSSDENARNSSAFIVKEQVNNTTEYFFAVRVAMLFDSLKTNHLFKRGHKEEIINFRGNVSPYTYDLGSTSITKDSHFVAIEGDSLLNQNFDGSIMKGKIVLLGYLGDYLNDPTYESKFYTPLNATFAGRSLPDMLGLVVHANIISMILNEDYINQLSKIWEFLIILVVVALNVLLFIRLFNKNSVWYDSLCLIIPAVQIIIVAWFRMELLATFNFRLDVQGLIYLIAFVSFATNLYFGPISSNINKLKLKFKKDSSQGSGDSEVE